MTRTVLVCGGRNYAEADVVSRVLSELHARHPIGRIVEGGALGADILAAVWAEENGIPTSSHPADWQTHGKSAGPIRNQQMLSATNPSLVVAFPGGKGTAHMVRIAREAGVPVIEVESVVPVESSSFGEPK